MPFEVSAETLESLEWERVSDALRACCRTPLGIALLADSAATDLFADTEARVLQRLEETTEARALIDQDLMPPFGGCADVTEEVGLAEKGFVLEANGLIEIRQTVEVMHATIDFFARREEDAPRLAELARELEAVPGLEAEIARCLDPGGEVRDAASPALAQARRDAKRLSADLQSRIERTLQNAEIAPHLSDTYYTVRNGRFVLPVKADAKGQVRGIVHDASRSGTTLFVEPDAMVELNNQHRQADLTVEREILRVMRDLSACVGREAAVLRRNLEILAELDLAVARGLLSRDMDAVAPAIGREGIFELAGLRHPLIAVEECVANDLRLGRDFSVLLLSGPNAGGKTVALKSVALAALLARAGMHVPADPGVRIDLVDCVLADIGDHQDIQESLSTFSAAMANLARILHSAGPDTLVCLDEVGVGTDPSEGAAIAQATLEILAEKGARVVTTTHYNLLKEMAEVDERFENASVEFDPETFAPTYRVRIGAPGASSATTVAARMGMPEDVLDRAKALLAREDRQLDRMLSELSASRSSLENEQTTARAQRLEAEQLRNEYETRLARLSERRDKLVGEMREELALSFRAAHEEVARITAELQRSPSSRRAGAAREKLQSLATETQAIHAESELLPSPPPAQAEAAEIDWSKAEVGLAVRMPGGGSGTLIALPDAKGRVSVQVAGAKVSVSRDQLRSGAPTGDRPATHVHAADRSRPTSSATALPPARMGGTSQVDLRGLRVEEALDRLESALDLAAAEGRDELRIIHGLGTGALKKAVRDTLPHSPFVIDWLEAEREDGGAGVTRGILSKD